MLRRLATVFKWYILTILTLAVGTYLFQYPANKRFDREILPKIDQRTGQNWNDVPSFDGGPYGYDQTQTDRVQAVIDDRAQQNDLTVTHGQAYYDKLKQDLLDAGVAPRDLSPLINSPHFQPAQLSTTYRRREQWVNSPEMVSYSLHWWIVPGLVIVGLAVLWRR